MALGTPFHSRTAPLCTSLRWKQWSGYFAAVAYDDFHDPEYHAIRNGAGLSTSRLSTSTTFRDPMRCGSSTGSSPGTRRSARSGRCSTPPGATTTARCCRTAASRGSRETTSARPRPSQTLAWFLLNAEGMDVEIEDVSERYGALALQGPRSARYPVARLQRGSHEARLFPLAASTELEGAPVVVTRTGYTGDLGYEIWVPVDHAERALGRARRRG